MYGKNNRILYSAKFPQGFKLVAPKRTRQGAGVPNGGTTIRVTGLGNPMPKTIVRPQGAATLTSLRHRGCHGETGIELRSLLVPKA
jgi:hypothetical protein